MKEQTATKIKYILYARKSSESEERQALSIPAQLDEGKKLAERLGIRLKDIREEAHSAKLPESRPVFNKIILDIVRASQKDTEIC